MHFVEAGSVWGMHLVWWFFWVALMVMIFGYNVPEKARRRSGNDPLVILNRRYARGEISEGEFKKMNAQIADDVETVRGNAFVSSRSVDTKRQGHPLIDGLTLSVSWIALYSICALIYWISPETILTATSKIFHGLSFTQMSQMGTGFSLGDYFSVVTLGAVYAFVVGLVGSSIHTLLLHSARPGRQATRRLQQAPLPQH